MLTQHAPSPKLSLSLSLARYLFQYFSNFRFLIEIQYSRNNNRIHRCKNHFEYDYFAIAQKLQNVNKITTEIVFFNNVHVMSFIVLRASKAENKIEKRKTRIETIR